MLDFKTYKTLSKLYDTLYKNSKAFKKNIDYFGYVKVRYDDSFSEEKVEIGDVNNYLGLEAITSKRLVSSIGSIYKSTPLGVGRVNSVIFSKIFNYEDTVAYSVVDCSDICCFGEFTIHSIKEHDTIFNINNYIPLKEEKGLWCNIKLPDKVKKGVAFISQLTGVSTSCYDIMKFYMYEGSLCLSLGSPYSDSFITKVYGDGNYFNCIKEACVGGNDSLKLEKDKGKSLILDSAIEDFIGSISSKNIKELYILAKKGHVISKGIYRVCDDGECIMYLM